MQCSISEENGDAAGFAKFFIDSAEKGFLTPLAPSVS